MSIEAWAVPVVGLLLAGLVGLSLGMLGAGGSILTAPIFIYVLGHSPREAIAMSLPVVGVVSLVGALRHRHAGNVALRTAIQFGAVAMIGAFLGARLAGALSGAQQLGILAFVMLVAGAAMLRPTPIQEREGSAHATPSASWKLAAIGLGVGILTGIVGIGGGFLIVPALVNLAGVPIRHAVGTSLVVIVMNAAGGSIGYLGQVSIGGTYLVAFIAVASLAAVAGIQLSHRVRAASLKLAFAVFILVVGAWMLYSNRSAFGLS